MRGHSQPAFAAEAGDARGAATERPATPRNATDCHFHVFGPPEIFPYAEGRTYTPAAVPKDRVLALHRAMGIERGVIVQAACHGHDHAALLDFLESGNGRYRGVGLVGPSVDADTLAAWHSAGMRATRFNFMAHLPKPDPANVRSAIERVAPLGWHVELHIDRSGIDTAAEILAMGLPVVIDHMARLDLSLGEDAWKRDLDRLLALAARDECWFKLSGLDRISHEAFPYADAMPIAHALVEAAPDRVVWGTDFPHPNHRNVPDTPRLIELVAMMAPDEAAQQRILVDNPARLFGFDTESA